MEIPVFQKGQWVIYTLPEDTPLWSRSHQLQAASVYAACMLNGHTEKDSRILAECFINKKLYKDLQYNTRIEGLLKKILV